MNLICSELDIGKLIQHIRSILWPPLPELEELEGNASRTIDESASPMEGDASEKGVDMKIHLHERLDNEFVCAESNQNQEPKTSLVTANCGNSNCFRTTYFTVDDQFDSLHQVLSKCCERIQYAKNLWVWEAKPVFIPCRFCKLFRQRRIERATIAEAWNLHVREMNGSDINHLMSPKKCKKTFTAEPPIPTEVEPQCDSEVPNSDQLNRKKTSVAVVQAKKQNFTAIPADQFSGQRKVSQFFTLIAKENQEELRTSSTIFDELFPSFFVKEFTSIASINQFLQRKLTASNSLRSPISPLQWFKTVRRSRRPATPQGKVMGAFEGDLFVKFKLFQFHDNYRPAYFGTMRKGIPSSIRPKNPFKQDTSGLLNYAIDSDQEWEEEELMDVEVISSEEDDSDFCESDLQASSDGSDDDFIIDEESEMAISNSASRRTKIHLVPSIISFQSEKNDSHGIYFVCYNVPGMPTNPFEAPTPTGSENAQKKFVAFDSCMIDSLAELAQDSPLNAEQLYDEFVRKTAKQVTKKSFQQALREIATRQRIAGQKYKWQLKEAACIPRPK